MAVGGWTFNDVTIIQQGMPIPVTQSNAKRDSGIQRHSRRSVQRPNLTGTSPCNSGITREPADELYQRGSVFCSSGPQLRQHSTHNELLWAGYLNTDLSLNKTFKVTERITRNSAPKL